MAYLKKIEPLQCRRCDKVARVELYNNANASNGAYCAPCGKAMLHMLTKIEREEKKA